MEMYPMRLRLQRLALLSAVLISIIPALAFAQSSVLTYHNDNLRTGQNLSESLLTPQNVRSASFGKVLTLPVDGKVDAQPLLVANVTIPNKGIHNVVFAATEHDSLYAFDADTGVAYWQVSLLRAGETTSDTRGCSQVSPEIGITATPAIDPAASPHGVIYVVAMSKDAAAGYHQRLHAIDMTTGAEQSGSPVDIQATYPGAGDNSVNGNVVFDAKQYKARPGLLLVGGVVYTSWSSHCDIRPYTGWTIGYNQTTLVQTSVFNFTPNGSQAAVWGAGAGASADPAGNLFFQLGNGTFDTVLNASGFPTTADFGNAFVKLSLVGGALKAVDYWTMSNTVAESNADEDLGSGGVLLLPDVTDAAGTIRHLGVGAGKDRTVYLFDRDNMGKFNAAGNGNIYQQLPTALGGSEFASPAWFNGFLYFGSVGDVIRAYKMTAGKLGTPQSSGTTTSFAFPGTTPSISANGTANAILWAVENSNPAVLHAYDANDLVTELYNSSQATASRDQFGAGNKFITPTIANGKVYVGTTNSVAVFGLLPVATLPTLTSLNPAAGTQGATVNVTLTGTNFSAPATVGGGGSGLTIGNVAVVSATGITAAFTLTSTATAGGHSVFVTTGAGNSNAQTFTVNAAAATPTLTTIAPNSAAQGTSANVTLTGTNFVSGATVAVSGVGVGVTGVTVASSTRITATLTIVASATVGVRNVSVSSTGGTSNPATFTVNAATPVPALTSVSPSGGAQGSAVNVTLTGTNFAAGATVGGSGNGLTVSNVVVASATQIKATFTLTSTATTGGHNIFVTTGGGNSNVQTFTINAAVATPALTSISPNSARRGTTTNVTLTGSNFIAGATLGISGSGVTVSNVKGVGGTQITATLTIGSGAASGARQISVTTTAGKSNSVSFTVGRRG
jgi:hypothetical protein